MPLCLNGHGWFVRASSRGNTSWITHIDSDDISEIFIRNIVVALHDLSGLLSMILCHFYLVTGQWKLSCLNICYIPVSYDLHVTVFQFDWSSRWKPIMNTNLITVNMHITMRFCLVIEQWMLSCMKYVLCPIILSPTCSHLSIWLVHLQEIPLINTNIIWIYTFQPNARTAARNSTVLDEPIIFRY